MDEGSIVEKKQVSDTITLCGNNVDKMDNKEILRENTKPIIKHKPIKEGSRVDRFCKEYLNNGKNIAQACVNAGYKAKNQSRTGVAILKRPEVIQHIASLDAQMKAVLLKDKPTFLLELRDLAERARKAGRIGDELKAKALEADILGITTPEQQQQINIFGALDKVENLLKTNNLTNHQIIDGESVPKSRENTSFIDETSNNEGFAG